LDLWNGIELKAGTNDYFEKGVEIWFKLAEFAFEHNILETYKRKLRKYKLII